ncbi:MAG: hypothetical protein C4523_17710 [Myxococcales bacterium]|nr:MAG: hypothetical protein C4523_17710 [Myxococcales bacterium]
MSVLTLRGDAVDISVEVNGQTKEVFTCAKSIDTTFNVDTEQVGYLGQSTDRTEEVFNGANATIELDQNTPEYLKLISFFVGRARQRLPGVKVNVSAKYTFPTGETQTVILQDVKARNPQLTAKSRRERVGGKLEVHSDEPLIVG